MAYKIVYRFSQENKITFHEVSSDYELQDRESFSLSGFYTPVWNNGVVEGATQVEINDTKLEYINRELDFEAENLLAGALRLVLNETGTLEQLKSKVEFFEQTYAWAKGELTGLYIDVDAKHTVILAEENADRDADNQMDMETYKITLVKVGAHKEILLKTFREMINQALEKTKRLRDHQRYDDAITSIGYMKGVSKNVTTNEASTLLTQILAI